MTTTTRHSNWLTALLALAGGAGITLSLAPFDLLPFALLGPALLYWLQRHQKGRPAFLTGWAFGIGFWGAGVSWVYVSIHTYGNASAALAGLLTGLFVVALGLLFAVQGWCFSKLAQPARQRWLVFSLVWVGFEWLRSWLLTGFPWLLLGYAWLDTPMQSWAPVGGVWLLSLLSVLLATGLVRLLVDRKPLALIPGALMAAIAFALPLNWTEPQDNKPLDVALIQPNIPQLAKWQPDNLQRILQHQISLSLPMADADLIVWPETAIPATFDRAAPVLTPFLNRLDAQGTALISGFPFAEADPESPRGHRFHNSIGVFSGGQDLYHKQRLVPFGEYVPFEAQLRGLIAFFDLPMSSFSLPTRDTDPLQLGELSIAPAVCYEIAYPGLVRSLANDSGILLTVSNDTWFGRSIAPDQHLQLARMRALENGRWLIRSTNNGLTAFVAPDGSIAALAPVDQATQLRYTLIPMSGLTPWQRFGLWPVTLLGLVLGLVAFWRPGQRNALKQYRPTV
ncbi:apolipoprotein N-acyltransferase [Marinobacterium sediminicola]|uniref:Apolipoprotein N-acyltransferase n=1 Tax=Marinobacterium sediminicola TaxID=518898 RepID=A0ABY1S092_9GAMM|nr:apolipoprotein N-acyltransferase [Marinobacterium sediminicola]ULG69650.1 apolipoprotein N-acyltransferase [Marinobacterium sediminicola]SMR74622.1 apolipoprotein N-acyltransferase [Marinobacterium sediminicola]